MTANNENNLNFIDQIAISVNATWDDYEHLLELRGDRREPRIFYDAGKLGVEGFFSDWDKPIIDFVDELLDDDEDLISAIAAETDSQNEQRISWEDVKQLLSL